MTAMTEIEMKLCKGPCGLEKPISFFRKNRRSRRELTPTQWRKSICLDCEFQARRGEAEIFERKAADWRRREAAKLGLTREKFDEWGLTQDYIVWLLHREWILVQEYGEIYCVNCKPSSPQIAEEKKPCYYKTISDVAGNEVTIPPRPGDLSVDIIDRERVKRMRKLTRSNIRVICGTANNKKGRQDPTKYDEFVENYNRDEAALGKGVQSSLNGKAKPAPSKRRQATRLEQQLKLQLSI